MSASSSISSFGCFHDFLRVEDTILEPILEPKNGIAAKKMGSKTPLVDSVLEPFFLGSKMVPKGVRSNLRGFICHSNVGVPDVSHHASQINRYSP